MPKTALQLVQSACYSAKLTPPSALVGETAQSTLQLLELFYDTGRELRASRIWPQLKRTHVIQLEPDRSHYHLPLDFYAALPATHYESTNNWAMSGPLSDSNWSLTVHGIGGASGVVREFRVFGPDSNTSSGRGQIQLTPTPDDGDAFTFITFDYVSKSWIIPPLWTPSETIAQNIYRFSAGNVYKKTDANSEAGSTVPPTVGAAGIGQDGGVFWQNVTSSAWQALTAYRAGTYADNGAGIVFRAIISGTSGNSGAPNFDSSSVAGDTETDGTVTWEFALDTAAAVWAAYTEYAPGDHVIKSSNLYLAVPGPFGPTTQKSGATGPTWTTSSGVHSQPDGSITFAYQPQAYEALVADTDLCVFDDELMIAGLKWRFLRASGAQYADVKFEYDDMVNGAQNRLNAGARFSMAADPEWYPVGRVAEGSWEEW